MAVASKDNSGASALSVRMVEVTDLEAVGLSDVTGGAATIYSLDLDNSANSAYTYFRMFDSGAPTMGTTNSDIMIPVQNAVRSVWIVAQGLSVGTGMTLMASTDDGAGAVDAAPSSSFNCSFTVV